MNMREEDVTRRLLDQRAELLAPKQQRIIPREAVGSYRHLLQSSLVKVVMGPRRSGKSVFCTQLLGDTPFVYANFDDELLAGMQAAELDLVVQAWSQTQGECATVLLDEVQNVAGWELFVNRLQRGGRNVLVTGSNSQLLSSELASHLTGRHRTLEVMPFSFREYLSYRDTRGGTGPRSTAELGAMRRHLADYLATGGFPETYREPEPRRYLLDLYQSVIARDIAFRHRIRNVATLRHIAQYLFAHLGTRVTHHKLRKIFSAGSVHTVQNYLGYLQESYLIFVLDRFSRKAKERHTAPRKVVPVDTGMARAIGGSADNPVGYLYETVVALELFRRRSWTDAMEVQYWQDRSGREVDFIVSVDSRPVSLIQACFDPSDPDTMNRERRALLAGAADTGCRNLLVVTDSHETETQADGRTIRFVPLWRWLLDTASHLPT